MADAAQRFEAGLSEVAATYRDALGCAENEMALREANARITGPQGALTKLMKLMREVPGDRRRELGQRANALKQEVEQLFDARLHEIMEALRQAELTGPRLDVTLPGRRPRPGRLHPITRVKHELMGVFESLGFDIAAGPEIDTHENCFDKLGFPPDHPATDMQDTFFLRGDDGEVDRRVLLRTHTSTIQVREMERRKPPFALVAPGVVYRRDDDPTHSPMFHQLECLVVDEGVSMAEMKGSLHVFLSRLFGEAVEVRLRPSYFPFVEPGAEVDARRPGGEWMEIGGCGMVHPVVFEHVGYDPERWTGFAFGMGIDRIAMVKFGVPHIEHLFQNDVRFLRSF